MVLAQMISLVEGALASSLGGYIVLSVIAIVAFLVAFLVTGMGFRYAVLLVFPLVPGLTAAGWLPTWVTGIFYVIAGGLGLFFAYTALKGEK